MLLAWSLLNAREYNTREGLHVLTVGHSVDDATPMTEIRRVIDGGLQHGALVVLDHPYVDNGETWTMGHISEEKEAELEALCKEYPGQVALEWNAYCVPWMRAGLKHAMNLVGGNVQYHDVNKKVERLSENLEAQGYNSPVVADTDLHARSKRHLDAMGTGHFVAHIGTSCGGEVVADMKHKVFAGLHENVKEYVDFWHSLTAFCLPMVLKPFYSKPRA